MLGTLVSLISSGIILVLTPKNPTHLKFQQENIRNLGYPFVYSPEEILTDEMVKHRICVIYAGSKFTLGTLSSLTPGSKVATQVGIPSVIRSTSIERVVDTPRAGFRGVQQQINHPKNSGKITVRMSNSQQVSTNVIPTQTQISGFVKDGKVNLKQAFSEVKRRASAIGCETFNCSFDRFKKLATECGKIDDRSVREAITILQGEMHGYYKNARRVDYGTNVKGLYFAVDGLGEFENITHAEAKNAVGSAIETADGFDANIWKQGKKIGKKSVWQKKFWSNPSRTSQVPNLNSDAYLPKSVNNILTVVDCYDVPNFEKETMNSAISFGAKNDTNLIILNNRTNI